ncbi:chorismate mutase aro7 [Blastocladiella emersonii ATCC 22665]|nr:chorismate mutase aro7 [Blastocladiella emersonii ATCC 22665]
MNFLDQNEKLSLDKLRNVLVRLEDTIIFGLIERAQFSRNDQIYVQGAFKFDGAPEYAGSFLDWFLHETEKIHARVRRYTSPDEYPFTDNLPAPILPVLDVKSHLVPNKINVNEHIKSMYLLNIVPSLCRAGDDGNYGSAATRDVECLQALSKRIHYGKFIAEAKFQADPDGYTALIRARDTEGLMRRLTNEAVELKLLKRLRRKAELYGQELDDEDIDAPAAADAGAESDDSGIVAPPAGATAPAASAEATHERRWSGSSDSVSLASDASSAAARRARKSRLDLDMVVSLYRDFVIPITKLVEVQYLLVRV